MDERDIEKFLAQLTPAQETVVLLREIKALLERHFDGDRDRPQVDGDISDLVHNISPQKTPFLEAGAGGLMRVTKSPEPNNKRKPK